MRALITRPAEDAERIAAPLRDRGVDVVLEPLLVILPSAGPALGMEGVQALLFTSANGARAFARASNDRIRPVYAVGDATAKVARELGFPSVVSANGDVEDLAALVRDRLSPDKGALIHVTGTATAGDLAGSLEVDGFTVRLERLYQARTAVAFSKETRVALSEGAIDAVFLFSPRTARTFASLVEKAGLTQAMNGVTIYALSAAVAEAVSALPTRATRVAADPTQDALLSLFDGDRGGDGPEPPRGADSGRVSQAEDSGRVEPEGTRKGGSQGMSTPSKDDRPEDMAKDDRPEDKDPEDKGQEGSGAEDKASDSSPSEAEATPQPWSAGTPVKVEEDSDESDAAYGGSAAAEDPAQSNAPASKKGNGLTLFILFLLVLAAAAGSYPWWRPQVPEVLRGYLPPIPGAPPSPAVVALEGSMDSLSGRVDAVEAEISALKSEVGAADGEDLAARLTGLERELAALRGASSSPAPSMGTSPTSSTSSGTTPAPGAIAAAPTPLGESDVILGLRADLENTKETIVDLRDQLGELETAQTALKDDQVPPATVLALAGRLTEVEGVARQANTRRNSALALLLAVGQLREAASQGEPFEAELKAVEVIAKGAGMTDLDLGALAPLAKTGVSTRAALRYPFETVSRSIAQAAIAPEGSDWMDRTLGALTSLVTVRRVDDGGAEGKGTLDLLSQAEVMVTRNDLAGAVQALEGLEGAPAEAAAPWIAAVKAKLAAESALSELTAEALAAVGAADALAPLEPAAGSATGTEG